MYGMSLKVTCEYSGSHCRGAAVDPGLDLLLQQEARSRTRSRISIEVEDREVHDRRRWAARLLVGPATPFFQSSPCSSSRAFSTVQSPNCVCPVRRRVRWCARRRRRSGHLGPDIQGNTFTVTRSLSDFKEVPRRASASVALRREQSLAVGRHHLWSSGWRRIPNGKNSGQVKTAVECSSADHSIRTRRGRCAVHFSMRKPPSPPA